MSKKTVQEIAGEYYDYFEWKKRDDGTKYICTTTDDENLKDLIYQAHKDSSDLLPDDYTYEFIYECLCLITDSEDLEDIGGIEPDVYTSDLTKWLNSANARIYYLTQALEEIEIKDGFQLLSYAQFFEKTDVLSSVINSLENIVGED